MFCAKCGSKLDDGAMFCAMCGNPATVISPPTGNTGAGIYVSASISDSV